MSRKAKIIAVVLLVIAAAAVYAYREYNRKPEGVRELKPDYSLNAQALIGEFDGNDSAANKKYLGKVLAVEGQLREIDAPTLTITLGSEGSMSAVRCSLDSSMSAVLPAMAKGKVIKVKGFCTGFNKDELLGTDVILNRTIIINE